MSRPPVLSIVIPAWNEEGRVGATLAATLTYLDRRGLAAEVLVVDDGSSDGTVRVVQEASARDPRVILLRLARNRGKGAAVRCGVLRSQGERVLFMDADLATPLEELAKLERAIDDGADVAIASRALPGSEIVRRQHVIREAMGKTFNFLVRGLLPFGFRDTQCGFKLFTRGAAIALFRAATVDRFAFDVEILLLARGRFRVEERAVVWRHIEQSKVSPVRDAARMALDVMSMRLRIGLRLALSRIGLARAPLDVENAGDKVRDGAPSRPR